MTKQIAITDEQLALLKKIMETVMDPDMINIDYLLDVEEPRDGEEWDAFDKRVEEQTELLHSLNKLVREG